MSISVTCERCDHQFDVPEESDGPETSCPECDATVPVPSTSEDAEDESELELEPRASDEEETEAPEESGATESEAESDLEDQESEEDQSDDSEDREPLEQGSGTEMISGRFELILQSIPVGLKLDTLIISALGVFVSVLVAYLFLILGFQTGNFTAMGLISFLGIVVSLSISFATFTAVSHLSTTRLRNEPVPKWNELVSFVFKNLASSQLVPFSLLMGLVVVFLLEYALGWIGAIPFIGGLFLLVLGVVYLLVNVFLLINLALGMWFTFPIVASDQSGFVDTFNTLYERICDRFIDSITNFAMVLLLMFAFLWVVLSFCLGAFNMTTLTLGSQTQTYIENTMGQEEDTNMRNDGFSFDGSQMRSRQFGGPFQSLFGQLMMALIFSILLGLINGPIVSMFYSGGCAVYLSGGEY